MSERSLTIATVRGIDIRIHVTWLFIAALITWSFWNRFTDLRGFDTLPALVMALVCGVLFFTSILVHELAHALEATHRGVDVAGITLFLFGGVTESKFDVRRPRDELALTAVGPFSSFVLAAVFGLASTAADGAGLSAAAEVLGVLGWVNFTLAVFNLLPGAPLDGGRILRSLVWWVTHDRHRAVRVASSVGRVLGVGLIVLGIAQVFLVRGGAVGGLWLAFIGWFLMQAATAELAQDQAMRLLHDVPVHRLLPRSPETVSADEPVAAAVDDVLRRHDIDHVAVRRDSEIVGVLGVDRVRDLDREARERTAVGDVMAPADELPSIDVDADASELLDLLGPKTSAVVATEGGRPVGVVSAQQLATALRRSAELGTDTSGRLRA